MKTILIACALGLTFPAGLPGQEAAQDRIGKAKAPQALMKALEAAAKGKGSHCTEKVEGGEAGRLEWTGVLVRDFAVLKGALDVYARGDRHLVRDSGGSFVTPSEVEGEDRAAAVACRNPHLFQADLRRFAGSALWNGEETLGDVECRIVQVFADDKAKGEQVNEIAAKIKEAKRFGNISAYIDKEKTVSVYRAWIGRADLRVHRITWELEPKIKEGSVPPGIKVPTDKLRARYEIGFSKFDEELEVEVPEAVRAKLGGK